MKTKLFILLTLCYFIFVFSLWTQEPPGENNYYSTYSHTQKDISGGVETIRYRDGEFYARSIFYFKNNERLEGLPPLSRPVNVPEVAKFNYVFSKWEDISIKDGKRLLYYGTSGKKAGYIEVEANVYEGEMQLFWPNGKMKKKVHYQNGKENGLIYFYNRRGELLESYTMRDGVADGEFCEYDKSGKIIKKKNEKIDRDFIEKYGFLG
ncbi:hypothetical protein EHQ52_14855 [Leptospira koniambonensis]|uniref:Toxin-antitoxin system YwqK family antitoxin n=1 Tax=Leptospira koniambonensis TaxID=2484950 RepID=A0A4R9J522_9LEPT|nr:hypothetical protein [Leptospira koniambonensis]TGL32561.1 hypothetical protein EHQ52_14855 [Leptospira koniambonensis]